METKKIRILHLSDIHYSEKQKDRIQKYILDPLLKKLETETKIIPVDLLCITGDLIDKGGIDSKDMQEAFLSCYSDFIEPIAQKLSIPKENIFICPGNHDIDVKSDSRRAELSLRNEFTTIDAVNDFLEKSKDLDAPDDHKRILQYKKFEREFYKNSKSSIVTPLSSIHVRKINGLKIGINCINSVWRYYDDNSELFIGKIQLDNENLKKFETNDINIALSHNNPNMIAKLETKDFDNRLAESYKLQLFGHTHDCDMYSKAKFDNDDFFVINSRSLSFTNIDTDKYEYFNGFAIIDYCLPTSELIYYPILYSQQRNEFVPDGLLTGEKETFITKKILGSNTELKEIHEISNYINKSILSKMDELMLANGTDSIAPQSFEDLFVEPTITYHGDDNKKIDLETILTDTNNYIIQGQKESGKTVLLNFFVKYYIDNIHQVKRIPIFLDSKNRINNLTTEIAHKIGIKPKDVSNILQQYKVALIIDNYDYKNLILSKQVLDIKNTYPNCKLIFSIGTISSGDISIDLVNNALYSLMSLLDLKNFSHTQIRLLADKWFKEKNCINDEKEEQIEKFLATFELPRTPMCISMFLWILEKQTDYQPINQSTMLENFIEQVLNKHGIEHEFRNQFDYKNKEKLLAAIAFVMFEKNKDNPNYSIKYSDLIDFTIEYLDNRQFEYNSKELVDSFINSGLLISVDDGTATWVRFRFNCFFTFFLMKNMEKSEFYEYVLEENNYLSFCDEINLFTGLKRDCSEILDIIVDRMDNLFESLRKTISDQDLHYDIFFETQLSFSDHIPSKKIRMLKDSNSENWKKYESMQDSLLQSSEINPSIETKDFNITPFEKMALSINLGLNVLRNTEEVDDKEYKEVMFSRILKNVLAFACLNKVIFIKTVREEYKDMDNDKKREIENFISFLPLIISELLENSLATNKLAIVFEKFLGRILNDKQISQMEKFLTMFVYFDSKGKNSRKLLSDFIKQIQYSYIKDCSFLKLFIYHIKAKNEKDRNAYIDSLVNLLEKKTPTPKGSKFNKSEAKKQLLNENILKQLADEIKNN